MNNLNKLEQEFKEFVEYLERSMVEGEHTQRKLKEVREEDIPEKFRRALRFYSGLAGDSKTFLFRVIKNPGVKKTHFTNKSSNRTPIKNFSPLAFIPK